MSALADHLLAWFDRDGRHDLPWQHPRTPYRVWLSEIMLQQTQVQTVIPYFTRFLDALPTLPDLAAADSDRVLALWAGLGYYARARNLHKAAQVCVERHGGDLPTDFDALAALPGIGRSTAGAILAQAHGLRFPILDGNVKRTLARYHGIAGWPGSAPVEKQLWTLSESHLPQTRLADYTQAIMDFGATLCTRHDPACVLCPLQDDCVARREGRVAQLPEAKPGKPLPERRTLMLLLHDADDRILLARRTGKGVWNGLWSLPEAGDHDEARSLLATHAGAGADFDAAEPLPVFEHVFSHYRLHIEPLRWRVADTRTATGDNADLRWQPRERLHELGLPAPVKKLLEGLP
ncbi:A/G-specific adenine glycosylase [Arenimonas caeni]|jgi:A/G-specific adenine glycosylase|uniref:Adenine DNA glycosylase n=1 Tax=Arenimonas caeni TaxID=2058085 RepID=A0A2P6M694_9GAMM|nr:A/G-specific adenine glycosylase [Arenimonas caeni]MDY0022308.1 A/G-specific adenine glycosylase [Arenimonas caeni]PRH81517.1 A/G-specific adenine glycosylase [Arenimonas caeni]